MKNQTAVKWDRETKGRKYPLEYFRIASRRVGGDGKWYGFHETYATLAEAEAALKLCFKNSRYVDVGGGLTLDCGPSTGELMERKIVKVIAQCEVIEVRVGNA